MKTVFLVTGAAGFIGRYLVRELSRRYQGKRIIALDARMDENTIAEEKKIKNVQFIKADLLAKKDLLMIPPTVNIVFHLAAFIPPAKEHDYIGKTLEVNVEGTYNLLNRISGFRNVRKFVYSSTISVYGSSARGSLSENSSAGPATIYGISKLHSERLIKLFSDERRFDYIILRYSSVYGFGQAKETVIPLFIEKAMKERDLQLYGEGKRFMDFVYVKDVVKANMIASRYPGSGIFNIGSGHPTKMSTLASCINRIFADSGCRIVFSDKKETAPSVFLDIKRARKIFGYKPDFGLKKGLLDYRALMEKYLL